MFRYTIIFNFILLSLLGCSSDSSLSSSDPTLFKLSDIQSDSIIIINGLSEDFTIIKDIHSHLPQSQQFTMGNLNQQDQFPCSAPNDIDQYNNYFYVTCSISNEIQVFNKSDLNHQKIFDLGNNINPMDTLIDKSTGFTTSFLKDKILVFNTTTQSVSKRIIEEINLLDLKLKTDSNLKTRPVPGGLKKIGNTLFVTLSNLTKTSKGSLVSGGPGYIAAINLSHKKIEKLIPLSGRNTSSLFHSDTPSLRNYIFAINTGTYDDSLGGYQRDGSIDKIDLNTYKIVKTIPIDGAPFKMVVSENGRAYVSNGQEGKILTFDIDSGQIYPSIDLRKNKCNDFSPKNFTNISSLLVSKNKLLATEFSSNCLFIIDTKTETITHQLKTGDGPTKAIMY